MLLQVLAVLRMTRVLLTGGCGFIGHHIVEHLLKNTDWKIVVLDRLDYASDGFDRLRDIEAFDDKRVSVYTWELTQPIPNFLDKEIGKCDYVIHIAAGSHVDNSITDPVKFIQDNVNSTLTMLEYARKVMPKKFIYFSTDEVYGTAPEGIDFKEGDRFNPGNPYSASKAASECICMAYSNTYKIPIQITNTMNVLGERQHPEKYLPRIIRAVMQAQKLTIHANKEKTKAGQRHYIHARNVADALLHIMVFVDEFLDNVDATKGRFNIVGEKEFDNLELAKFVANYLKLPLHYEMVDFHSCRPGHDLRYALSGEKLERLGWKHPVSIETSIKRIVDWSLKTENSKWIFSEEKLINKVTDN